MLTLRAQPTPHSDAVGYAMDDAYRWTVSVMTWFGTHYALPASRHQLAVVNVDIWKNSLFERLHRTFSPFSSFSFFQIYMKMNQHGEKMLVAKSDWHRFRRVGSDASGATQLDHPAAVTILANPPQRTFTVRWRSSAVAALEYKQSSATANADDWNIPKNFKTNEKKKFIPVMFSSEMTLETTALHSSLRSLSVFCCCWYSAWRQFNKGNWIMKFTGCSLVERYWKTARERNFNSSSITAGHLR